MRFSARIFLAALLLSAYCLAQSRNPYESSTEDNVYTNFFFRFRCTIPVRFDKPWFLVQQLYKFLPGVGACNIVIAEAPGFFENVLLDIVKKVDQRD